METQTVTVTGPAIVVHGFDWKEQKQIVEVYENPADADLAARSRSLAQSFLPEGHTDTFRAHSTAQEELDRAGRWLGAYQISGSD